MNEDLIFAELAVIRKGKQKNYDISWNYKSRNHISIAQCITDLNDVFAGLECVIRNQNDTSSKKFYIFVSPGLVADVRKEFCSNIVTEPEIFFDVDTDNNCIKICEIGYYEIYADWVGIKGKSFGLNQYVFMVDDGDNHALAMISKND